MRFHDQFAVLSSSEIPTVNRIAFILVFVASVSFVCAADTPGSSADVEHYERKIRPLLINHCYECHSSESEPVHGGLRVDSRPALTKGGDSGSAIDLTDSNASLILEVVRYHGDIQMPPKGKLSKREIAELTKWVENGAPMPAAQDDVPGHNDDIDFVAARDFWSFRPFQIHQPPNVSDDSWPRSKLDQFVLAAMNREGLTPSPQADRRTLVRRLYFDLTGLPPIPEEVESFVNDDSPQAFEVLMDTLLDSPHYGEKWGRMWLDLARYTDRTATWLYATGQAHLYRDWVIAAFNHDMPYDEFIHRQLATDLMPETGPEDIPALGFLALSPTYWKELKLPCEIIKTIVADEWEERVDAISRNFLGLTVACARCHDHKFDPITSEDYYALAGVFASCRQTERPIISETLYAPVRTAKNEVKKLEDKLTTLKKQKPLPKDKIAALDEEISRIKASTLHFDTPMANAISEESMFVVRAGKSPQDGTRLDYRPEPRDLPLYVRGNPNRPGPVVPRRFLTVLTTPKASTDAPHRFTNGSGRLDLARSITGDAASLTARVIVNRIWHEHFGRGIVDTPSNFGQQGDRPSHPQLLDHLAARFIENGWSIKQLHREILTSAAWQQSSQHDEQRVLADPDNRWLSRANRRRLSFEAWRDSMLAASADLDLTIGGPSVDLESGDNHRRTVYATIHRRDMSTTLTMHDFPDPTQHSPTRSQTTTALQGLYALNGPLLNQQARALVQRLQKDSDNDYQRIDDAYHLLYSRLPTNAERAAGLEFLGASEESEYAQCWKQYVHVLLAANELLYVD